MAGLKKLDLSRLDLEAGKAMVREAASAIERGELSCAPITAAKDTP